MKLARVYCLLLSSACAALLFAGCAARSSQDRASVSGKVQERTGHGLAQPGASLPASVDLTDGVSEDDAIAIALWNNSGFQAELARLGIARADLTDSKFLRNPFFSLLFPLGPKQLEATVSWPLEQLWLRPRKMRIAQKELDRVTETLVQQGLNLMRDVCQAHAAALAAEREKDLAGERAAVELQIAEIMSARLRSGDISEREFGQAQLAALEAQEASNEAVRNSQLAMEKLRGLLGWSEAGTEFRLADSGGSVFTLSAAEALLKDAFAARPDLRAAELAIEAAGERAKLEKSRIFTITAVLDMNGEGKQGFEAGPGLQTEAPIASLNNAGRARAAAELEVAMKRYAATRQQIAEEVRSSLARYQAATEAADRWTRQLLPRGEEELRLSQKSYEAGDASYLATLQSRVAWLALRKRALQATTERVQAQIDLERSVGHRLAQK